MHEEVWDAWWPWRLGRIEKRTKGTIRVRWDDGEVWSYDRQHVKFLCPLSVVAPPVDEKAPR